MKAAALSVKNLCKSYGAVSAVKDISFEVPQGEIFGLLGPNGAGKSTTINMITGLSRLGGGHVSIFGFDNKTDFVKTRCLTGVMHQETTIDNFFTVEQSLKIHAGYYGLADDVLWREKLVDDLALRPYLQRKPLQLSGGTKRRLMMAKALIHKPKLLILDEPTAGVDVELRLIVWKLVRELNRNGTTILLTTHYLEEAQEMCARVAIMSQGRIVALENTRDLVDKIKEKRIILRFSEALVALPEQLKFLGAVLSSNSKELSVPFSDSATLGLALRAVDDFRGKIEDIEIVRPTLEDAFLKLTGNGGHNLGSKV